MPTEAGKEDIHENLLMLLNKFHQLCIDNGIKYSLHGGSLLGAVREKGFIPWDDDADVTMTRDNYEKFRMCMNDANLDSCIILDEITDNSPMVWMRADDGGMVWIDIFIYDYISESWLAQKMKFIMLVFFLGWLRTKERMNVARMYGHFTGWKYCIMYVLYLLGKPISRLHKNKIRDYFVANFLCGSKKLMVRSNDKYIALKCFISEEAISKYMEVPFEDITLMIHAGYDEILKSSYGSNYMNPIKTDAVHQKCI